MSAQSMEDLLLKIEELENRLAESEQLIDAIKAGEVDAFAINNNEQSEIYTLQSGDYAYRVLIEEFGEGALNVTEEGLIVYTNTAFFELLNLPYEKVVGASVFSFIHPDSADKFASLFKLALEEKGKGEINLAVNDKVIPVYISMTSLQPKLATVGIIITDFTEKKKNEEVILEYQKSLESKNQELIQRNTELSSFGYVASHDLQEPLRKIRTFSNLILEKQGAHFPQGIRDYFARIISNATRMQDLITALLNYSRTEANETLFEPCDLNSIIETVQYNLRELIDEKHVTIEVAPLPNLNIIPNQFIQLFTNIIGNAIKYKRPGVDPLVKISAEIVDMPEMKNFVQQPDGRYWKIKVADNGIGFDQKYADKIFELFQRLYTDSEYEGTGIGLAICKKIVQNHHGYISATGQVDEGAVFNIYMPVKKINDAQ